MLINLFNVVWHHLYKTKYSTSADQFGLELNNQNSFIHNCPKNFCGFFQLVFFWNVCSKGSQLSFFCYFGWFCLRNGCCLLPVVFKMSALWFCEIINANYFLQILLVFVLFCVLFYHCQHSLWAAAECCWKIVLTNDNFWLNGTILSSSRRDNPAGSNKQQVKEMEIEKGKA